MTAFESHIAVISDIHFVAGKTSSATRFDRLIRACELISSSNVECVGLLGDTTDFADKSSEQRVASVIRTLRCPVFFVLGNHDSSSTLSGPLREYARPCLPSGHALGANFRLVGVQIRPLDQGTRAIAIVDSRLAEQAGHGVVVLSHYPILRLPPPPSFPPGYEPTLDNEAAIRALILRRGDPAIILHGHHHARRMTQNGAVLQIGVGSLSESPFDVTLVSFKAVPFLEVDVTRVNLESDERSREQFTLEETASEWSTKVDRP